MPQITLDIDRETWTCLLKKAVAERRPIAFQIEVMLRRACDLPFPYDEADESDGKQKEDKSS